MTPFSGPVALKALIKNSEGKVLVCLNSFPGEPWDLPGGTLHAGEHPHDALKRELKEELGINILVGRAVAVDHFIKRATGKQTVVVMLEAMLIEDQSIELVDGEITEVKWIGIEDLEEARLFPEYERAVRLVLE